MKPESELPGARPTPHLPTLFLASALACGFLNVAVSLIVFPAEQQYVEILFLNISTSVAVFLVLQLMAWLAIVKPLSLVLPWPETSSAPVLALAALGTAVCYPILDYARQDSRELLLPIAVVFALLLVVALIFGLRWITQLASSPGFGHQVSVWSLRSLLFSAATLLLAWALFVKIHFRKGPSKALQLEAFLWLVVAVVVVAMVWRVGMKLVRRSRARVFLPVILICVLALPVWPWLWAHRSLLGGTNTDLRSEQPRAIVLITIDTLRADAIGPSQESSERAPRIGELMSDSIVFLHARSPSSWTKPSMASMLTGVSPLIHGALRPVSSLKDRLVTVAELLQAEGFRTAAIGRNSNLAASFGFDQGFDFFRMYLGSGETINPSVGSRVLDSLGLGLTRPSTDQLSISAAQWIRRNHRRPFFFWLHIFDPHAPYAPPRRWLEEETHEDGFTSFDDLSKVRQGTRVLRAPDKRRVKALYDAEVRYVDRAVGELLGTMKELRIYDSSLVVLSSDHGEEFFEHGGMSHGHTLYDELLRVPLLVKLPFSRPTGDVEVDVSTESVTPTILDVAGVEADAGIFSAPSLSPLWDGSASSGWKVPILSSGLLHFENRVSFVHDGWKYIRFDESGAEELYRLDLDPGERRSVVGEDEEMLQDARSALSEYLEWIGSFQSISDTGSLPDDERDLPKSVREDLEALGYIQ